jgi:hypothetical protein
LDQRNSQETTASASAHHRRGYRRVMAER